MVLFLGLFCIVGGFITVMPLFMNKYPLLSRIDDKITPYKILIGLSILIISVIKLLVPYHAPGKPIVPILGDLVPSALGILVGILISIDFLETLKGVEGGKVKKMRNFLEKYQFLLGFASIFFGFLHWIIFKVIFF